MIDFWYSAHDENSCRLLDECYSMTIFWIFSLKLFCLLFTDILCVTLSTDTTHQTGWFIHYDKMKYIEKRTNNLLRVNFLSGVCASIMAYEHMNKYIDRPRDCVASDCVPAHTHTHVHYTCLTLWHFRRAEQRTHG